MKNFKFERDTNPNQFCVEVVCEQGTFHYPNIEMAQSNPDFETIDPKVNGRKFTWGMYNDFCEDHQKHQMRFEDWEVNRLMSV